MHNTDSTYVLCRSNSVGVTGPNGPVLHTCPISDSSVPAWTSLQGSSSATLRSFSSSYPGCCSSVVVILIFFSTQRSCVLKATNKTTLA